MALVAYIMGLVGGADNIPAFFFPAVKAGKFFTGKQVFELSPAYGAI